MKRLVRTDVTKQGLEMKDMVPTDTATYSALPWHGIRNVDPSTILDTNIEVSNRGQPSELESHVIEDRYGTSKVPLA